MGKKKVKGGINFGGLSIKKIIFQDAKDNDEGISLISLETDLNSFFNIILSGEKGSNVIVERVDENKFPSEVFKIEKLLLDVRSKGLSSSKYSLKLMIKTREEVLEYDFLINVPEVRKLEKTVYCLYDIRNYLYLYNYNNVLVQKIDKKNDTESSKRHDDFLKFFGYLKAQLSEYERHFNFDELFSEKQHSFPKNSGKKGKTAKNWQ